MPLRTTACLLSLLAVLILGGCSTPSPGSHAAAADQQKIADLTQGIIDLGDGVDVQEAARAARIAVTYSRQLEREYNVTDPPLIHNMKVNAGLRPRGLCYQWADDLEARLQQEHFRTLTLHRAIANGFNPILIDHSTVLISRRGDTMYQAIILDPWRYGGRLFWSPTLEDKRYEWVPQATVFAERRRQEAARARLAGGA